MTVLESFLAVIMFAGALWYLYRKFFITGGCTCGSSGCCPSRNSQFGSSTATETGCQGCKEWSKKKKLFQ